MSHQERVRVRGDWLGKRASYLRIEVQHMICLSTSHYQTDLETLSTNKIKSQFSQVSKKKSRLFNLIDKLSDGRQQKLFFIKRRKSNRANNCVHHWIKGQARPERSRALTVLWGLTSKTQMVYMSPSKKRKIKGVLKSRKKDEIQGGRPNLFEIKVRIHNNLRSRIALLCVVSELSRQSELGLYIVIVI